MKDLEIQFSRPGRAKKSFIRITVENYQVRKEDTPGISVMVRSNFRVGSFLEQVSRNWEIRNYVSSANAKR
jgi:hypothetical protein